MPSMSGPGSNGNEGVLRIPQGPSITGNSPWDYLVLYSGHSLGGSYPSAEVQSVYSTAPADWAIIGTTTGEVIRLYNANYIFKTLYICYTKGTSGGVTVSKLD